LGAVRGHHEQCPSPGNDRRSFVVDVSKRGDGRAGSDPRSTMADRDPDDQGRFDGDDDRPDQSGDEPGGWPPASGGPGFDPSDLGSRLEQVLGQAAENPELAAAMRSMGVDPTDPATTAAMRAQLGTFMSAQQSPTGARDLATDVARKHVLAA